MRLEVVFCDFRYGDTCQSEDPEARLFAASEGSSTLSDAQRLLR